MDSIYIFNRESGGYGGVSHSALEDVEKQLLGLEIYQAHEYYKLRKTYFKSREDAEEYALPIAKKAFEYFIFDWKEDSKDCYGEEDPAIAEWEKRGFHMVRKEELKEGDPLYEVYHCKEEVTGFICPAEHDYDRIGGFYGSISKGKVY